MRATANYATERAQVRCEPQIDPRELIEQVERAGYTARRVDDVACFDEQTQQARRGADLRRRLTVAAVLAVPLCDLSLALSLFPEPRFPGWQWVYLALATPVVGWCALPLHRAALATAGRTGAPPRAVGRNHPRFHRSLGALARCVPPS